MFLLSEIVHERCINIDDKSYLPIYIVKVIRDKDIGIQAI